MHDREKTTEQLLAELTALRQRNAVLEDIACRSQQMELSLRQREADYRQLIDGSIQGISITVQDGTRVFVNHAFATIFGYDRVEDVLDKKYVELIAPHDRSRVERLRTARLRGEALPSRYEYQGVRKDGQYIWLEGVFSRISWEGQAALMITIIDITERRRAEESLRRTNQELERRVAKRTVALQRAHAALRHSEEKFSKAFHLSPDLLVISRLSDNTLLEINTRFTEITGYTREDIDGRTAADLHYWVSPEDRDRFADQIDLYGACYNFETKFRTKSGRIFDAVISGNVIDIANEPCLITITHDITARKQAERTLHESEGRFRHLIEGSIQGIMIHRYEDVLFVNQAFATMHGYDSPAEILQHNSPLACVAPHERDRLRGFVQRRLRGEEVPTHYECQGLCKDGTLIWRENRVRVVTWKGAPALQVTAVDISERKHAEEALRKSEEQLRLIMDNVPIRISYLDRHLHFQVTNRASADWLNLPLSRIIGAHVADILGEDAYRALLPYVERVLRGQEVSFETWLPYQHGGERYVNITYVPHISDNGDMLGFFAVVEDITERKRLEAQLSQAHKMEAIGTLAGGIAHDFNNILAAIIGYTELTLFALSPDSQAWYNLQEVLQAGERARELIKQILTFSRQSDTERKPIKLYTVVTEALRLLRASLPATIEIESHLSTETLTVLADPTQLQQVLMNLCANAEHAMRQTGGLLEICLESIEADAALAARHTGLSPGPYARLTVRDTGQGMEPTILERIFEPFFTTKNVGEGTGLGLAVVHGIVTNHGGTIAVKSSIGQGTTCTVYLPRLLAATEVVTHAEEQLPFGKGCILFVDDEAVLAHLAVKMLEQFGYEVVSKTSSAEALELFRTVPQHFDLVITDHTMPHMTGIQLARELRHIRPDIPIILCTGFTHERVSAETPGVTLDAFCMKPLAMSDLAHTVREVLDRRVHQECLPIS